MKARRIKDDRVPFSAIVPGVASERIKHEAKRRGVSARTMFEELISTIAKTDFQHTRDRRLEKYGFSYDNVDWDNEEQVSGIIIAEYVMLHLPPGPGELQ